jgi:phage terminase large subunit-like protein
VIDPALYDGKPVAWVSPTYKSLGDIWRQAMDLFSPVIKHKTEVDKRMEFISGGSLEMWSYEAVDQMRGRKYARVVLDESAMMRNLLEDWNLVIRPTLMDMHGDAYFLSTPKGRNDFMTVYELGQSDDAEWMSWRFPTASNPFIDPSEISGMRLTMPTRAYEQEIEARFIDEISGALWKLGNIDAHRVHAIPDGVILRRIGIGVDPAVTATSKSDETGIIAAGLGDDDHAYVLADASGIYSPLQWAHKVVSQYDTLSADIIVAESNQGGDLVGANLKGVRSTVNFKTVHASKGKYTRAEPIAALYEQGRVHHVGFFPELEMQQTFWSPQDDKDSPDRVDALVYIMTELMLTNLRRQARSYQG